MKKLILAATVLALAGMNIQSAKAGVAVSISLNTRPAGYYVSTPAYCPPPARVYCPPPVVVCRPPVVFVHPRPVCAPAFVNVRLGHHGHFSRAHRHNW